MTTEQAKFYVSPAEARRFVHDVLEANGVSSANATTTAACLVAADLRGVDTHGMNRIPSYVERIRQGVLDPAAEPTINQVTPAAAQVDGHNGFGFVAAHKGMELAIESAKVYGIGMASIKRSNHFGMSAWLVQQAIDAAQKYEWPADNIDARNPDSHFIVLVSFEGRIEEPEMPPPRVWVVPFREIEQFLYREARLLDERRFDEWLEMFTDDGVYSLPIAVSDDPREPALISDSKAGMEERVFRLMDTAAHAQTPPSRTQHDISNVRLADAGGEDGDARDRGHGDDKRKEAGTY
jgi:hypothetical protein